MSGIHSSQKSRVFTLGFFRFLPFISTWQKLRDFSPGTFFPVVFPGFNNPRQAQDFHQEYLVCKLKNIFMDNYLVKN
jgi:hypothetical protein